MRLTYVYIGGSEKESSVQRKVTCQILQLREHGIDAKGLFFSSQVSTDLQLSEHIKIVKIPDLNITKKYFKNYFEQDALYAFIHQYLNINSDSFDYLFIRHGYSCPEYFKLLEEMASRIFLYIPSNTIEENYQERRSAGNAGPLSLLFRWWEYYRYFYIYEKKFIKRYLKKLKATVVFTPEFAEILQNKGAHNAKFIYNRDGADCANVAVRDSNVDRNGKIKLLFMKGSSMNQPWSGIDRLARSIEKYGQDRFELYITGRVFEKNLDSFDFVKLTGRLSTEELVKLTDTVDLGVSNLANYLIHFNQTTNLKSREYFASGLPFIQANHMPDIDGTSGEQYYLRLPNNADLIDMESVYQFALKMRNDKQHAQNMRKYAEQYLDWKVTVAELAKSLQKVTNFE